MNRNCMMDLVEWKENCCQNPLLLCGTKGTGKTYLAIDFAKNNYSQYLYLNFELNQVAREKFSNEILGGKNISEIVADFFQVEPSYLSGVLIVFDEITFCPPLYRALEHYHEAAVLAICSQFPGKEAYDCFQVVCLYPLGFDEFLSAVGNEWYKDIIKGHFATEQPIPDIVHQELLALFEEYLVVGGMPASINEYLYSNSTDNVAEVLLGVMTRIRHSLEATLEPSDASKAIQVLDVLPKQLARENKKFRFNTIRKGVTYALYQDSICALEESGVVLKLEQENKENHFKLYLPDVGMLSATFGGQMNETIRKALIENYVMQTLHQSKEYSLSFWESEAQAKVEFVLCRKGIKTPVELRTSSNSKGKSIGAYYANHSNNNGERFLRVGDENFYSTDVLKYIPIYALFCMI